MHITIIIPHYRTAKMTAYSVSQFFKFKGHHNINILIGDNNAGDGSINLLAPFRNSITVINYPKDKMQSHGIVIDYILSLGFVKTEYFIAAESDSFPTEEGWLDLYENIIKCGYDGAGSLLQLSGGQYMHPAGALYKTSIWQEAKKYCDNIQYKYLPNIAMKEDFPCHLMVKNELFEAFCEYPENYVKLHHSYNKDTPSKIAEKAIQYEPVTQPFHSGLGQLQEAFSTYSQRTAVTDSPGILLKNDVDLIFRMGYEPGQWLHYWMIATGKKLFYIPTKTIWMPKRVNQQQEYTINDAGFKHLWGVSAYAECTAENVQDIVKFKAQQMDELYESIKYPDNAGV